MAARPCAHRLSLERFGYALTGPLVLAQGAALVGLWGLTFLAVAISRARRCSPTSGAIRRAPVAARCCVPLVVARRARRLRRGPAGAHADDFVDGVRLRIMQPNLPQDEKFNYGAKQQVMARYLALSDRATGPQPTGMRDVTHLIWPESAFPFFLQREADALAQIADLLPPGTVLITGAARPAEPAPTKKSRAPTTRSM